MRCRIGQIGLKRTGKIGRSAGQNRVLAGRCVYGCAVCTAVAERWGILLTLTVPAGRVQVRGVGGSDVGRGVGRMRCCSGCGCVGSKRWQTGRSRRFGTVANTPRWFLPSFSLFHVRWWHSFGFDPFVTRSKVTSNIKKKKTQQIKFGSQVQPRPPTENKRKEKIGRRKI